MIRIFIVLYDYSMDNLFLREEQYDEEKPYYDFICGVSAIGEKWAHYSAQRILFDLFKKTIPIRQLHCFYIEEKSGYTTNYYFKFFGDIENLIGKDVKIKKFSEEDLAWMDPINFEPHVKYVKAMLRTFVQIRSINSLDPQKVNSLCPL